MPRANRRQRIDDSLAGIFRRTAANRLEHARAFGINVAPGRNSHPALHHRAKIGDDVAEHIVRDDHVEPFRVLYKPHRGCVYVRVIALDLGVIFLPDLVKGSLPQIKRIGQHIRLAAQRQFSVLVPFSRVIKRIAQTTLDASPSVDAFLNRNLVRRSFEHKSA